MDLYFYLKFGAIFASSYFGGASSYCSIVEHPARTETNTKFACVQFKTGFKRVAIYQTTAVIIGSGCSFALYHKKKNILWAVSGAILLSILPITIFIIMPVNNQLFNENFINQIDENKEKKEKAEQLLNSWGWRHALRSVCGLIASGVAIYAALN
jgi:hypothetical protein